MAAGASLALLALPLCRADAQETPELRFSKEGKFKIVQFTDTHYSDLESKEKGESREVMAARAAKLKESLFATMNRVLDDERPNLVVFTGDNVLTANNPFEHWRQLVAPAVERGIPWAAVLGNHDSECVHESPRAIMGFLETLPLSLCKRGPEELGGGGNYAASVKSASLTQARAALYFMDTGAYADKSLAEGYAWVGFDKTQWFRKQASEFTKANGGKPLPSLVFLHIPPPEFKEALATSKFIGAKKEAVCCPELNSGLFVAMLESRSVLGCFSGHDHDNNCAASFHGILLAYGCKTGEFCYFHHPLGGARVIELEEGKRSFSTWLRLGNGAQESLICYPDSFPPPRKAK